MFWQRSKRRLGRRGDGNDSSSASDGRRRQRARKKVSDFALNPLPPVPGWLAWKQETEHKLLSATEIDEDYVYQWLMKIGDPSTPEREIREVPNRLRRLDAKFRACLTDILNREMPRGINLSIEETKNNEKNQKNIHVVTIKR